jgi:Uma2 family endonuclease
VWEYWVVDPETRTVAQYRRREGRLESVGEHRDRIEYRHEDAAAVVDLSQVW